MIFINEISNQTGSSVQLKLDNDELIIDFYNGFDEPIRSFYFDQEATVKIIKQLQNTLKTI